MSLKPKRPYVNKSPQTRELRQTKVYIMRFCQHRYSRI